jgi:hypothetical protein
MQLEFALAAELHDRSISDSGTGASGNGRTSGPTQGGSPERERLQHLPAPGNCWGAASAEPIRAMPVVRLNIDKGS